MTRKYILAAALLCVSVSGMEITDETAHETVYKAPDTVKNVVKEDHSGDSKKLYEKDHDSIL
jgi:hypothetical protein